MNPGDILVEVDALTNGRGQQRVLVKRRGESEPIGWASTRAGNGSVLLTAYDDGLDDDKQIMPRIIKTEPTLPARTGEAALSEETETANANDQHQAAAPKSAQVRPLKLKVVQPGAVEPGTRYKVSLVAAAHHIASEAAVAAP